MITGHGGNIYGLARRLGCTPTAIVDMSSNVNPLGPMAGLQRELESHLRVITALPEAGAEGIIGKFAERFGVDARCVLAGNGTTQLIYTFPLVLSSRRVLIVGPTYADYADACTMFGVAHDFFLAKDTAGFRIDVQDLARSAQNVDTVFVCNPNNPTGRLIPAPDLEWLFRRLPETVFIVDESYMPFAPSEAADSVLARGFPNVVVLHSLSKIFRIPGLRIGFLVGPEDITSRISRYRLPWNVNSLAHVAVNYLMTHRQEVDVFVRESRAFLAGEKRHLEAGLSRREGMTVFESQTSFVLIRLPGRLRAQFVCDRLAREKVLIRDCSNFVGLDDRFIRVSLKTRAFNQVVIDTLIELSEQDRAAGDRPTHGKTA